MSETRVCLKSDQTSAIISASNHDDTAVGTTLRAARIFPMQTTATSDSDQPRCLLS
jgi:hypothetical protein